RTRATRSPSAAPSGWRRLRASRWGRGRLVVRLSRTPSATGGGRGAHTRQGRDGAGDGGWSEVGPGRHGPANDGPGRDSPREDGSGLDGSGPDGSESRPYRGAREGTSGVGRTTRVNEPRCSSSRPLPPRDVTSYLAVLMVCSAPRLVSTVIRSRSPLEATTPSTRSAAGSILIRMTPLPGPARKLTSETGHSIARARRVAAITVSVPVTTSTSTTSAPSAGRAKRRPARVLTSAYGARLKRSA